MSISESSMRSLFTTEPQSVFADHLQRGPCANKDRPKHPCARLAKRGGILCSQCNKVAKQQEDKTIKTEIIRKREALFDFQLKVKKTKMFAAVTEHYRDLYLAELIEAQKEAGKLDKLNSEIERLFAQAAEVVGETLSSPIPPRRHVTARRTSPQQTTTPAPQQQATRPAPQPEPTTENNSIWYVSSDESGGVDLDESSDESEIDLDDFSDDSSDESSDILADIDSEMLQVSSDGPLPSPTPLSPISERLSTISFEEPASPLQSRASTDSFSKGTPVGQAQLTSLKQNLLGPYVEEFNSMK